MDKIRDMLKRTASKLSLGRAESSETLGGSAADRGKHAEAEAAAAAAASLPAVLRGEPHPPDAPFGFIALGPTGALVDTATGAEFRWVSFNIPGLLMLEDRPPVVWGFPLCRAPVAHPQLDCNGVGYGHENGRSCIAWTPALAAAHPEVPCATDWVEPDPWEQADAVRTVAAMGGRVARTYTLGIGPRYHLAAPGVFNERPFVAMDHALAAARRFGVRLVVPLLNHFRWFGDLNDLARMRGRDALTFYGDQRLRQDLKDLITHMLNRINTVTGTRYGDDPTILAWQLGNELGGWHETPPPADWSIEIAQHIKSLAPRTLVMDGTLGGHHASKRYPRASLESPYIDIFSNHYYSGEADAGMLARDARHVRRFRKAFVAGEVGLMPTPALDKLLRRAAADANVSGAMVWSLRFHSALGGLYTHHEKDAFWSLHAPGLPTAFFGGRPDVDGFDADEQAVVRIVRRRALEMWGDQIRVAVDRVPFPVPPKPEPVLDVSPRKLNWRGSAWAASYTVWRREDPPPPPQQQQQSQQPQQHTPPSSSAVDHASSAADPGAGWTLVAQQVLPCVKWGGPMVCDDAAAAGRAYWYRIVANGVDGRCSDALVIGPISAEQ
ncbi:hypothetical protein HK105_202187 [Polyrhizophydium stewartii]|uniref:mannan endo-1,4-beta-mannosidase n=1 Tax=Polyrhizophydium stewartii TaxID=2732419 RepID=A0ABR4NFG4_9FUNG